MKVYICSLSRCVHWLSLQIRNVLPVTSEILGKLLTDNEDCWWKDDIVMVKASKIEINIKSLLKIWPSIKKPPPNNQQKNPHHRNKTQTRIKISRPSVPQFPMYKTGRTPLSLSSPIEADWSKDWAFMCISTVSKSYRKPVATEDFSYMT